MRDSIKEMANRFYNLPEPKEEVNLHKGMFHIVKAMELIGIDENWKKPEMVKLFSQIPQTIEGFAARFGSADERIKIMRAIISDKPR